MFKKLWLLLVVKNWALFLILGLLMSSFGCYHYQAKPLSNVKSLSDWQERRLDSAELANFLISNREVKSWPPEVWDLKSLTLVAFYFNPEMDLARARWGVVKAGRITAGEIPNPTITPKLGYNSTTPTSLMSPWIPEVSLEIPIEVAGKRGLRIAQAKHLSEAARWNILATAWKIRSELKQSLIDLYYSQERQKILQQTISIEKELVRLMELKKSAGEISGYDLARARMELNAAELKLAEATESTNKALIRLAAVLGLSPEAISGIKISYDDVEKLSESLPEIAGLRRQALTNRADILAALAEYAASEADLRLEIAKQYPDLKLGPGYQLDQTDNKWTIGMSFELPVFNRHRGPITEAENRRREKASSFLELQSRVLTDLEKSVLSYKAMLEKTKITENLLTNLDTQLAKAEKKLAVGEISRFDFLTLKLEWVNTYLTRLENLVQTQQALCELENVLQSPLQVKDWIYTLDRAENSEQKVK